MKILQGVLVVALSLAGLTNGEDDGDLRQEQINYRTAHLVYDRNHYFVIGPILKPKPKLADTFDRYCTHYRNHISKGECNYR